jgi:spermidine/putrescine transport system permease protein
VGRGERGLTSPEPEDPAVEDDRRAIPFRRGPGEGRAATLGLLSGPLLWLGIFFLLPVAFIAAYSVGAIHILPNDAGVISLEDWKRFLIGDAFYLSLFWKSIRMSLTVSIVVVLLSYPVGYFLAMCVRKRKYVLLLLIIAPFLTSFLLRVLAWKVILGDRGVINSLLVSLHVRSPDDPIGWLLYSQFAVMLVLAYVWIPFVALPIFVSLDNLDRSLLEASTDLGASRWRTFLRITFPLSLPGVIAAFVFVFVPTIGEFVTPQLVGGTSGYMFGNAIQDAFTRALDWQSGSVLALFLLVVVAGLMALFGRYIRVQSVAG